LSYGWDSKRCETKQGNAATSPNEHDRRPVRGCEHASDDRRDRPEERPAEEVDARHPAEQVAGDVLKIVIQSHGREKVKPSPSRI
jgi:hypothetical protein